MSGPAASVASVENDPKPTLGTLSKNGSLSYILFRPGQGQSKCAK